MLLNGTESLPDLGVDVDWREGSDHDEVIFTLKDPTTKKWAGDIHVTVTGEMDVYGFAEHHGASTFASMPDLRKKTALFVWCYRTAYEKVFREQHVDQLLFK